MRAKITLILGIVTGISACVEAEPQPPEPQVVVPELQDVQQGLTIELDQPARLVGHHRAAAGVLVARFEAKHDEAGAITSNVVRLGDKVFEWSTNGVEKFLTFDGHDAVLTEEDHEAFGALKDELLARFEGAAQPPSPQLRSLLAHVLWLHAGGVGVSVPRKTMPLSGVQRMDDTGEVAYGYGRDLIDCARFGQPYYGWQPLCVNDRDRTGTHWATANIQPCKGSNTNAGCPPTNEAWSALSNGSLACHRSGCGCPGNASKANCASPGGDTGNWSCAGQCGIGCQGGPHYGRYQDCFEHDVCAFYYGSRRCGPDWWSATTAFSIATSDYGTCDGGKWFSSCPGVN